MRREALRAPPPAAATSGAPSGSSFVASFTGGAEGAATPAAVFTRAKDALARHDFPVFVRCIAPPTRKRWTEDVAFAAALESRESPTDHDLGARRKKAITREILRVFGAQARITDEPLSVNVVTERLFAEVRDPEGLLAALLSFAEAHGAPLDPVRALSPTGVDGVTTEGEGKAPATPSARATRTPRPGSAASAGLRRLGERLEAAEQLGELDESDATHPTALVKVTGEVAPVVLRFACGGGLCFLDES